MNKRVFLYFGAAFVFLAIQLVAPMQLAAVDFLDDSAYEEFPEESGMYDPLEPFNRVMFTFNDTLYIWVVEPVSTAYSYVLPEDIRDTVDNFFNNLGEPVRSVNCLLQGRFSDAGTALGRFFINTICGVGGLGDPARTEFGIEPVRATLGQTLGSWGIGDGFYLVVPFFGPSTLRDFTGSVGDGLALSLYTPWNDDLKTSAAATGIESANYISLHLGAYEEMKKLSFDPYIAFRNGYFQMRDKNYRQHSSVNKIKQ